MDSRKTAYITGGASGIGRSLASQLLSQGWRVFIADNNVKLAQEEQSLHFAECDTSSWESQLAAFRSGLKALGGRIDFVAPVAGIGEVPWLPVFEEMEVRAKEGVFVKPNLSVIDVDLNGVLYTIALAVQQMRAQQPTERYRGKIAPVASMCGLYYLRTMPIYTSAKHGVVAFTRSYGKLLKDEGITLNCVAPSIVRTGIALKPLFDSVEEKGLLTPMEGLMDAFKDIIGSDGSGEIYECGPNGGWANRQAMSYLDKKTEDSCDLLTLGTYGLHYSNRPT
ncbi:hypothetical protein SVAN01_02133 [Stagonosporopsis vannaccii]|nr:hypothetical protein SVAN01_02133 [Stagonosporopsis vannaccii]